MVAEPDGKTVGTVDEDFAVESLAGDVFLLGTTPGASSASSRAACAWKTPMARRPSIPFWRGEAPGRTVELSEAVSNVREEIAATSQSAHAFPASNECGLDEAGAEQAIAYVPAGAASLGALPTQKTVVAERFFDEGGGMQLVIHAPFGSRINRAWGLALRKRFCRSFNFELQAAATDNGIVISLTEQHAFPLELVFEFLKPQTRRARADAGPAGRADVHRALALERVARAGHSALQRRPQGSAAHPAHARRRSAGGRLSRSGGLRREPDRRDPHPRSSAGERNHRQLPARGDGSRRPAGACSKASRSGAIRKVAIDNAEPSPFSHEILNANPYAYLDDAPLEERRARAVQLRRTLRTDVSGGAGILDPAAIATVAAESWPDVRDADELHDALLTLIRCRRSSRVAGLLRRARRRRPRRIIERGGKHSGLPPSGCICTDEALPTVRGWMESLGPVTAAALAGTPGAPARRRSSRRCCSSNPKAR